MDFFNSRTFEMFRYIIPSTLAIIFSLWIFRYGKDVSLLKSDFDNLGLLVGLFSILLLYVIGIFIDEFVYRLYRIVKKARKNLKASYVSKNTLSLSEKYSILRMKSNENFTYVEYWNALKGMCRNLAFVGFYMFFCLVYDMIFGEFRAGILIFSIVVLIFNYLMILRADLYSDFANSELNSSIDALEN